MKVTSLLNRVGTYELDVCRDCDVVWFDPGELSEAPVTPEILARTRRYYDENTDAFNALADPLYWDHCYGGSGPFPITQIVSGFHHHHGYHHHHSHAPVEVVAVILLLEMLFTPAGPLTKRKKPIIP